MTYQINLDNQDGIATIKLSPLSVSVQGPTDQEQIIPSVHVSRSPGVMRQQECCMPELTPTGK